MSDLRWSLWCWMLAMALMATASSVVHATAPAVAMPDALQGITWAGSQCERPPQDRVMDDPSARGSAPDLKCMLTVQTLFDRQSRVKQAASEYTWVDVRVASGSGNDVQPQVLRMPVEHLFTKGFLRQKRLLLVGDGSNDAYLLSQCGRLKGHGFVDVRVLQGGWPHWQAWQAVRSEGRAVMLPEVVRLDIAGVWAAAHEETWLVLGLRANGMSRLVPFSREVEAWATANIRAVLEQRRRALGAVPLLGITLLLEPADDRAALVNALRQELMPLPVTVHVNTAADLERGLMQLEASWAARVRGPRQPRCGQ